MTLHITVFYFHYYTVLHCVIIFYLLILLWTKFEVVPIFYFFFCLLSFFVVVVVAISWAAPGAYGGSQARGPIGAVATGLRQSHSNAGSEPCLQPTPQLRATPDR